ICARQNTTEGKSAQPDLRKRKTPTFEPVIHSPTEGKSAQPELRKRRTPSVVNGGGKRGEGGHESFFRDFFMVTDGVPLWRVTPALVSVSTPTSGHSVRIVSRHLLNSL